MKPVPQLRSAPGSGVRLMTGKALNRLLDALNARTPLNAAAANDAGFRGIAGKGGAARPGPVAERLDVGKVYFVQKEFMVRLAGDVARRAPRVVTGATPRTQTRPQTAPATTAGLKEVVRAVERVTPRLPVYHSATGYRLGIAKPRTAKVEIWVQARTGHSRPCFYALPDPLDAGYITSRVTTNTYQNGSYTQTWNATGDIEAYGPGETPSVCDEIDYSDTYDSAFDYGSFVSVASVDTLVGWAAATTAAEGAVEDSGAPFLKWQAAFSEDGWKAASALERDQFIWTSSSAVGYVEGLGNLGGWNVSAPKFQIRNTGQTALKATVRFVRLSDEHEETITVRVARGQQSAWLAVQTAQAGETWTASVSRLKMGKFLATA